jgi:hypothetical protein
MGAVSKNEESTGRQGKRMAPASSLARGGAVEAQYYTSGVRADHSENASDDDELLDHAHLLWLAPPSEREDALPSFLS